jgi:Protein phosphatase 2C
MGHCVRNGGWRYAAASAIGTSHQKSPDGICQDAHALHFDPNLEAFVAVVSDGAGSASQSQIGSQRTCDFVLKAIADASPTIVFSGTFAAGVLEGLRMDLQQTADEAGLALRDYACTMLVAIVGLDKAAFWQIGDGAICFRNRGADKFSYVFWPEKGDYANVTFFVTDQNAHSHLEHDFYAADLEDIALLSDGLERLALDFVAGDVHNGFFDGLFPYVRSLPEAGHSKDLSAQVASFLASERVNKRTDDDKTLVLASRV